MDFNDTPQEAAFREEVRAWLAENVPTEAEFAGLDEMVRFARGESFDEQPMADIDSEAIDFQAASEFFPSFGS